ncbi:MAG: hypothetical protein H0W90_08830 [Actinobacteria bacterium]|nr:hypothetical protein [Actinomycetota bacterium]
MPDPDPQKERDEREAEAKAAKAEADAAKAAADAAKGQADVRQAEANARKAEQEAADHDDPVAVRAREADARKKTAESDKDAAAARRARYSALIPDLGAVKDSTLDVKEGPPLWSTFLTRRALGAAGTAVAAKIEPPDGASWRVMVTSDAELATTDAIYADVKEGLDELVKAADKVLEETKEETVKTAGFTPLDTAIDAAGAVASAVPAVLSLLSAKRTVSTAEATVADLAAAAAVAGALAGRAANLVVAHDDFRLLRGDGIYTVAGTVSGKRQELAARQLALGDIKSDIEGDLATAKAARDALKKAQPPPSDKDHEHAEREVVGLEERLKKVELRLGLIESLLTACDAFTASIRAVPEGGRRSLLASAALHEQLHGNGPSYTHVLLVKAQSGLAQQMINNLPLWWKDKFSTAVDASVTYFLIATADSTIVGAGTETAVATAHGKIGDKPTVD